MIFLSNKKCRTHTFILLSLILVGCATYYQKNALIQDYITSGRYEDAEKKLSNNTKAETGKDRVLNFFNQGVVLFMLGEYEKSNEYLNKADLYNEDYRKQPVNEMLSLISNPMIKPYHPEDFEMVMVHFYKSLNYLFLKNYEDALVECRRINIQLQQLNDKYKKVKNKYANDAFAHNLMGMIYDAAGDKNNAFIAYRNAYECYTDEYTPLFHINPPNQLKKDLLRTAYELGFTKEYEEYKQLFNIEYNPEEEKSSLVFLWMNGFGPIKSEWSINFTNIGGDAGWVTFYNDDYNLNFPIFIGNRSKNEKTAFENLSILRIAFPKYVERKPLYSNATLYVSDQQQDYPLELSQDINAIAFQSLKDRMLREVTNGIARLATKKALESIANKQNENLGTIVSIINAFTEQADTRNWQSLPYAIHYTRIPLPEGNHEIKMIINNDPEIQETFSFNIKKDQTTFFAYHELEQQ